MRSRTARVNGIAAYDSGPKDGKSILFVHGFPFSHIMWDNQVEHFGEKYRCVTYDIRGLGESAVGDGKYSIDSFVDDLYGVARTLKLDMPVICGLSMGGYITLRAAERRGYEIGGLVLCNTNSEADSAETRNLRNEGMKLIDSSGSGTFVKAFVPKTFYEKSIKDLGSKYTELLEAWSLADPVGVKGCMAAMRDRSETTPFLEKIDVPTLVLAGEHDAFRKPEYMRSMADKINGAEFKIVPESGHMSPVENPEFFNRALENFMKKIK